MSTVISGLQRELTCCFDAKSLPILEREVLASRHRIMDLRSRGVKFRCVTEMSQDNLTRCKELMKDFELYHAPELVGGFLIADRRDYLGFLSSGGPSRILRVTDPSFVNGQLFLLGKIFDKALPAKQRLVEIVRGTTNEFIETIRDPAKTKSLVVELIRSAVYEVEVLFSTRNSFIIAEKHGILQELGQASERGAKIKILVMRDETVREISDTKLRPSYENLTLNYLQQFLPTKITTVIADQSRSLTIEVNDDTKDSWQEAVGIATYANSESTVFSNASMFESLWIQSELDKQNKARQTYFQLFSGSKLKDEIYSRRWSSAKEKETEKD
jgi:hypothetical protein